MVGGLKLEVFELAQLLWRVGLRSERIPLLFSIGWPSLLLLLLFSPAAPWWCYCFLCHLLTPPPPFNLDAAATTSVLRNDCWPHTKTPARS